MDDLYRKEVMHDFWRAKALALLEEIVEKEERIAHLEWRERFFG